MAARILIIDGDITLSTVLSDYLDSRGYKAQRVSDGKAGLEALAAGSWDAVLMELQGVGMNGYELIKDIRHRLPNIPLLVVTTRSDREDQMRAFQLGADDYQKQTYSNQHRYNGPRKQNDQQQTSAPVQAPPISQQQTPSLGATELKISGYDLFQ